MARIRWLKVGDVDGAVRGDRHPGREVELGGVAGAVGKPGGAVPARVVTDRWSG
jgi:hypothetical protein